MRNVSTRYKEIIDGTRTFCVKVQVTYADGSTDTFDELSDFMAFKIDDACSGQSDFAVGSAIINEADISLKNRDGRFAEKDFYGATLDVWTGLVVDGAPELLKMGHYIVDEPVSPGISIRLLAYDNMLLLDRMYVPGIPFPATRAALAQDACEQCGVSLAGADFSSAEELVQAAPTEVTCREVVAAVAQLGGCFARCDADGKVEIRWYAESVSKTITSLRQKSVCTDDVTITGIDVYSGSELLASTGADGYKLAIKDNPLLETDKAQEVADYLAERLVGLSFRPLKVSCKSDPSLEAGDMVQVVDGDHEYVTLVTHTNFTMHSAQKVECNAASPAVNSTQRLADIAKAIIKERSYTKEYVHVQMSAYEEASKALSGILANSLGYFQTVEPQEDGSSITYLHDKPLLTDSQTIWKQTADAFAVSTDGGSTWNAGLDSDGNATVNMLAAIGINADWIKTGALTIQTEDGDINFYANADTGEVRINASSVMFSSSETVEEALQTTRDELAGIEVGGRNLLKNTDVLYTTTVDANQPIVQSFNVYSDLYDTLIGKQLTLSIYADTTGEYMFYSGDGSANCFIAFFCIWLNSISGQTVSQGYGMSEVSALGIDNRRVSATSEVITQPSGYDKLASVQVMIQGYAKPAEEGVTWTIGRPKLEIGNVATDWTPAPEDIETRVTSAETRITQNADSITAAASRITANETNIASLQVTAKGLTSSVETLSDDFDTLGESSGSLVTIEDAVDDSLQDITIYGKSTQASTPTPDAPVDVVSIGDAGNSTVYSRGRNLIDASRLATKTAGGATVTNNGDGSFTVSGSGTLTAAFSQGYDYAFEEMGIVTAGTYTLATDGVSTYPLFGMQYRTASGTATSLVITNSALTGVTGGTFTVTQEMLDDGYRIRFIFYGASGNAITGGTFFPMCYKGEETLDFESYKETTATITENLPLRGLPVTSGGNYTDASGQQWVCDSIEKYADGTGKHIQRCKYGRVKYTSWYKASSTAIDRYYAPIAYIFTDVNRSTFNEVICSHFAYATSAETVGLCTVSSAGNIGFAFAEYGTTAIADFQDFIDNNDVRVLYALAAPIETPLTAEEVSAFETLTSYKDCTNVFTDEGADIKVTYIRDTPLADTVSRVSKSESRITQLADEIELKVDKDGVISSINLTPETVKIEAEKIDLVGKVTADMMAVESLSAINANLGTVTSGKIQSTDYVEDQQGTIFDLDSDRIYSKSDTYGVVNSSMITGYARSDAGTIMWTQSSSETQGYPEVEIKMGEFTTNNVKYKSSGIEFNGYNDILYGENRIYTPHLDTKILYCIEEVVSTSVIAESVSCKSIEVLGNSFELTVAASTTTTLYDFSDAETGIYEIMVTSGDTTAIYATVCKSTASVAMSSPITTTTISAALSQSGQYTVAIKNGTTAEQTFSCKVVKKN